MKEKSKQYLNELIERYPNLEKCHKEIIEATQLIIDSYNSGNKLLACGNGGSAADSEHIVGELMKGFILPRCISHELKEKLNDEYLSNALQYGLPAISLVSHTALSTAFSNDQAPEVCFAQQVLGYGKKGDVLICISTSGNSKNCVLAAKVAKAIGVKVVSLTGAKDSKLLELSDVTIKAPEFATFKIQEYHLPIYHAMCLAIENEFYGE